MSEINAADVRDVIYPEVNDLQLLSPERYDWAVRLEIEVQQLMATTCGGRSDVVAAAERFDLSPSTMYALLRKYRHDPTLASLLPGHSNGGRGGSRLAVEVEKAIPGLRTDCIKALPNASIREQANYIRSGIAKLGLTAPSANTIRSRILDIPIRQRTRERDGAKYANEKHVPMVGSAPELTAPLQRVQIDCTLIDLLVTSTLNRKIIGRPWIIVAIDEYTRALLGFILTFESPSAAMVAMLLARVVSPKQEWATRIGLEFAWPMYGKPAEIYVDSGPEFKNRALERGCKQHDIKLKHRPPGRPRWGGIIERLIGTLNNELHFLAEALPAVMKARSLDFDPGAKASKTIDELERYIAIFFAGKYHMRSHAHHRSMARIPASPYGVWQAATIGTDAEPGPGLPAVIADPERFSVAFMPLDTRHVHREGIIWSYAWYWNDALTLYVEDGDKREFVVRRNLLDMGAIWFTHPDGELLRCEARDPRWKGIQAWEVERVMKSIRDDDQTMSEGTILEATLAMRVNGGAIVGQRGGEKAGQ